AGKNCGRAIALMDVAIDGHRRTNLVVTLHAADGDGHVVDHTKAFAVIGEGVMESSADADRHAVVQGMVGGEYGTSSSNSSSAVSVPVFNLWTYCGVCTSSTSWSVAGRGATKSEGSAIPDASSRS